MDKNLQYTLSLKDLFSSKMKDAENATGRLDSKVNGLGSRLKTLAVGVGIGALAKGIYDAGTNMDSLSVSLKTMLGNKKEADKLLSDMITFAKTTPFQQDEVATAGKQLLAFGIEAKNIIPTMRALGDVSAGLNQPVGEIAYLFGTIKTQGKAMTVDIRQFANRGIPIYEELAKVTGKSGMALQKFIEEGKVGFPEIEKAFTNMSGKGGKFFNLMGELSQTTGGQMSNLKDQLIGLAVTAFKLLQPAINAIIKGLASLMGFIQRNIDTISFLVKTTLLLVGAFYAYKAIMTSIAILQGGKMLFSLISLTAGLQGTTVAQYALNTAMMANPIGLVIGAIALLVLQLKVLYDQYERIKGQFQKAETGIQSTYFKGVASEVNKLADSYERMGMSRKEAEGKAIGDVSGKIDAGMAKNFAKLKSGEITKEAFDYSAKVGATAKAGLKNIFNKPSLASSTNPSLSEVGTGGKSTSTGGTEISGTKPQSLVINITKLVESLNINTTNLKESADRIKEEVSKALLEAVNDVNLIAR